MFVLFSCVCKWSAQSDLKCLKHRKNSLADFSTSSFDFGQPFKPQQSSTTSSSATTTTSSASLATSSFTPTPQPRRVTAPSTNAAIKQPSLVPSSKSSPLTIQPTVEAVIASQPEKKEEPSSAREAPSTMKPAPLPKDLKTVLSQYKALYQFDGEGPDELSIKPGDIILVCKMFRGTLSLKEQSDSCNKFEK